MQQHLGQHRRIEKAQVDALPRQRVDGVRGIADQRQPRLDIALGMALTQWNAQTAVGMQHLAQAMLEGLAQLDTEGGIIQRHQALGLSRYGGPDDRAPVLVSRPRQRQEGQRAVIGETLPGGGLMRLLAAHTGDDRVVQVIPFTRGATGQATHCRVGTIGCHQ